MRLLLTSSGITNASIRDALVDLLGKPIAEASALIIPTALYPFPGGGGMVWRALSGAGGGLLAGLGWKSLGVLELTALPSIEDDAWVPTVRETDALLVWGGDVLYLSHWMCASGLAALLPELRPEMVYVGVSAGSMAATTLSVDAMMIGPLACRYRFSGAASNWLVACLSCWWRLTFRTRRGRLRR